MPTCGLTGLPPLVEKAVAAARRAGFRNSCLPSHGRLLQLLAAGIGEGVIGETGTGCGVGLAWLASAARTGVRLVSVEHDWLLADTARSVFAEVPAVTVLHGDWTELRAEAPFALLALDGGGQGKGTDPAISPARVGAAGRHDRDGRLHADPGVAADARRPAGRRAAALAGAPGPAGRDDQHRARRGHQWWRR